MRKSLILAIALLAVGLMVVQAQDMRRLEQLQAELEQIEARVEARGGNTTPQEAQRAVQIQQEILQALGPYGEMYQFLPQGNTGTNDGDRQLQQIEQMQRQALQQGQNIQPQQQQIQQQGQNAGWPPASAFQSYFRISPLTQPAGTTARYDGGDRGMEIYLTGGNANTVQQNLKQQVERITGRQMPENRYDGGYIDSIQDPNQRSNDNSIQFWLRTENNVVILSIRAVAQ